MAGRDCAGVVDSPHRSGARCAAGERAHHQGSLCAQVGGGRAACSPAAGILHALRTWGAHRAPCAARPRLVALLCSCPRRPRRSLGSCGRVCVHPPSASRGPRTRSRLSLPQNCGGDGGMYSAASGGAPPHTVRMATPTPRPAWSRCLCLAQPSPTLPPNATPETSESVPGHWPSPFTPSPLPIVSSPVLAKFTALFCLRPNPITAWPQH